MKRIRVGLRTFGLDQLHRRERIHALRNEDAGSHGHAAMRAVGTMRKDLAAVLNDRECGFCSAHERLDGNRNQRRIKGREPEPLNGSRMRVSVGHPLEAHIEDEAHAQIPQGVVILFVRRGADEEVISDGGEVHGRKDSIKWKVGSGKWKDGCKIEGVGRLVNW